MGAEADADGKDDVKAEYLDTGDKKKWIKIRVIDPSPGGINSCQTIQNNKNVKQ